MYQHLRAKVKGTVAVIRKTLSLFSHLQTNFNLTEQKFSMYISWTGPCFSGL